MYITRNIVQIILICMNWLIKCQNDEYTLKMISIIFRHGHRAPTSSKYNLNKWNDYGELTAVGTRQAFLLGKEIRNRYILKNNLLPKKFDFKSIYVESTPFSRTIMSAQAFLAGLYPPQTGPQLAQDYPVIRGIPPIDISGIDLKEFGLDSLPYQYQPIPIYIRPSPICQKSEQFWKTNQQTNIELFKKLTINFKEEIHILNNIYNTTNITIYDILRIYDAWISDYYQYNPLPYNDTTSLFWKNLNIMNNMYFYLTYQSSQEINNIIATPYLTALKNQFILKSQGKLQQNAQIFAAHDTSIGPILASLNITYGPCINNSYSTQQENCPGYPMYTANLIFELYHNQIHQQYFVKLKYLDKEYSPCANQQKMCSLDEFIQFIESKTVEDYDIKCDNIPQIYENQITWITYTVLFLAVTTTLLLFIVFLFKKNITKSSKLGFLTESIMNVKSNFK